MQIGFCHVGLPKDAVKLLSPSGAVLALRHDVRYAFAAWLAQQAALSAGGAAAVPDSLRRYEVRVMQCVAARTLHFATCCCNMHVGRMQV